MVDLSYYKKAAKEYRPDKIRVLFIAESPPAFLNDAKKSYFFFNRNPGADILFATIIKAIYKTEYRKRHGNKPELLTRFQDDGYWLMDAVEYPINKIDDRNVPKSGRTKEILSNRKSLFSRLGSLRRQGMLQPDTGIILIKKLVFELLYDPLSEAGYRVLHTRKIDFPKYYGDRDTIRGTRRALRKL